MKKSLTFALVGLASLFAAQSASAIMLCDSYNKTWDLAIVGDTLIGNRDTGNALGCGPLYVRGLFSGSSLSTHVITTSLDGNVGSCQPVIWDFDWQGANGPGSGTWYNNNGAGSGAFTISQGACTGVAADSGAADPAE